MPKNLTLLKAKLKSLQKKITKLNLDLLELLQLDITEPPFLVIREISEEDENRILSGIQEIELPESG